MSLGLNSVAIVYERQLIERLGLKPPAPMTWKDVGDLSVEITKAAKGGGFAGGRRRTQSQPSKHGSASAASTCTPWMASLGLARTTSRTFLLTGPTFASAGCVAPDVQALDKLTPENSMLSLGKAAISFANSNQLVAYQALTKSKLGMTMYPRRVPKAGQYLKPSQLLSLSARARDPQPL